MRRVEIPIVTGVETTPQTHEAAEMEEDKEAAPSPAVVPRSIAQSASKSKIPISYGVAGAEFGGSSQGAMGSLSSNAANTSSGAGGGMGTGSGVDRASDAIKEGDVTTNAFDDFFEYALTAPVTIHKNQSAMVPILQQELPAQHVTLWSEKEPTPLRAVWLENKSKLTLDSGSFSIFESGEFAGEGLLESRRRSLADHAQTDRRPRISEEGRNRKAQRPDLADQLRLGCEKQKIATPATKTCRRGPRHGNRESGIRKRGWGGRGARSRYSRDPSHKTLRPRAETRLGAGAKGHRNLSTLLLLVLFPAANRRVESLVGQLKASDR